MIMIMKLRDEATTEPRRSTRIRTAPEWYGNPVMNVMLVEQRRTCELQGSDGWALSPRNG